MATQMLLVRPVAGTVGERARVVHVLVVPPGAWREHRLTACCGAKFGPGEVELLGKVSGMPCEACLRQVPTPEQLALPAGPGDIFARLAAIEASVDRLGEEVDALTKQLAAILRIHANQRR